MAVLIKDPEADRLIRDLAHRTGESITDAVRTAVEQRLNRLPPRRGRINRKKLAEAQAYFASLPGLADRPTDDEIIGYNDEGHFDGSSSIPRPWSRCSCASGDARCSWS